MLFIWDLWEKLNYEIQKMLDLRKSAQTTNTGYNSSLLTGSNKSDFTVLDSLLLSYFRSLYYWGQKIAWSVYSFSLIYTYPLPFSLLLSGSTSSAGHFCKSLNIFQQWCSCRTTWPIHYREHCFVSWTQENNVMEAHTSDWLDSAVANASINEMWHMHPQEEWISFLLDR